MTVGDGAPKRTVADGSPVQVHLEDVLDRLLPSARDWSHDITIREIVTLYLETTTEKARRLNRKAIAVGLTPDEARQIGVYLSPLPNTVEKVLPREAAERGLLTPKLRALAAYLDGEIQERAKYERLPREVTGALGALQYACDEVSREFKELMLRYVARSVVPLRSDSLAGTLRQREQIKGRYRSEIADRVLAALERSSVTAGLEFWVGYAKLGRGWIPLEPPLDDFPAVEAHDEAISRARKEQAEMERDKFGMPGGRPTTVTMARDDMLRVMQGRAEAILVSTPSARPDEVADRLVSEDGASRAIATKAVNRARRAREQRDAGRREAKRRRARRRLRNSPPSGPQR